MLDTIFLTLKATIVGLLGKYITGTNLDIVSFIINMAAILMFAPLLMMYLTLLERKIIARLQDRWGPNRVGPFGLLQPIADGVKMLLKEDITPTAADKVLHLLAPVIV